MTEYLVRYSTYQEIEFEIEDLKDIFPDEWEETDPSESEVIRDDEFIRMLIKEYGFDYLVDCDVVKSLGWLGTDLDVESK